MLVQKLSAECNSGLINSRIIFKLKNPKIQIFFPNFYLRKIENSQLEKNKFNKINYVYCSACFAEFKSYFNVKIGLD